MRVGLDYRPALVNREGIGRYTRELVRGLHELRFDGNLGLFGYTLKGRRFSREELGLAGSRAELLRLRLPSRILPWMLAKTGKGVDDLVGGCQVYHHTQPNLLHVRSAQEVVTIFDCIYALDAHNSDGPGYLDAEVAEGMTASARRMVERASRILVPTEFVGAEVVLTLGAHPGRVMVTRLGCDHVLTHLPPGGYPAAQDPFVLTVSRVDRRKNHVRMLAAFELLVREGFPHRWIVAGPRGFGCEDFERALEHSSARERVDWRTSVDDAELTRLYSQADVLLWASLSEGFGLPPLEAMACGTPVVTSCVTSMPEVCGDAAFLVEPTDVERIFEATRRLLAEPELAEAFRAKGSARAREYTWRDCARDTLLAYQSAEKSDAAEPKMGGLF
ncbi:MAG: glycosyltransferase family 4 protein [bacterium]|nr:glycosyltransferase family 4 protein [bacterium]